MSPVPHTTDAVVPAATHAGGHEPTALVRLSAARAAFALVWAGLLAATAADLGAASVTLLVLYPLVDLAAASYDVRSGGAGRSRRALLVNIGLSLAAAVGVTIAATSGIPDVLRVWGVWAIATGVLQLVVARQRRGLGGQRALVLSGAISTLAGASFILSAGGDDASLTSLAGYAALGGLFFLAAAVLLKRDSREETAV